MGFSDEGRFQVAVGAVIERNSDNALLLLKRNSRADFEPGIWEFVTGRVKQFEEPLHALVREIKEETGLVNVEIVKLFRVAHLFRGEPTAENELILLVYWCRVASPRVAISHEHEDFQWVAPQEALTLVKHPGVKSDIAAFIQEKECTIGANQ